MLENWNIELNLDNHCVWIKGFGITIHYFTGQNVKGNSILPNSKFFEPSIDIFSFHYWFISWTIILFNKTKQKSIIPLFHHSNIPVFQLWEKPTKF